jgi:hypothetical protein
VCCLASNSRGQWSVGNDPEAVFQVFIVLSPADEAGPAVCTRVHGGGAVLVVHRVVFLILAFGSSRRPPSLIDVVLKSLGR